MNNLQIATLMKIYNALQIYDDLYTATINPISNKIAFWYSYGSYYWLIFIDSRGRMIKYTDNLYMIIGPKALEPEHI